MSLFRFGLFVGGFACGWLFWCLVFCCWASLVQARIFSSYSSNSSAPVPVQKKKTPKPGSSGATTAGDREPQMGVRRVLVSGRQLQPFWSIPGAGGEGSLL